MNPSDSLLQQLRQALPALRSQIYFKASLTALCHAIEDLVLAKKHALAPLVIANFQKEQYYRPEARRYQRLAQCSDQVYVLATPDSEFGQESVPYAQIPLAPEDQLAQELHLVVIAQDESFCLVCQEFAAPIHSATLEQARQFKGFWTFDRLVCQEAARLLLDRMLGYQPDLADRIQQAKTRFDLEQSPPTIAIQQPIAKGATHREERLTDRLITYLQASQYKLLKAYRAIATQERKERLINSMTALIRQSLTPSAILSAVVQELAREFAPCRCVIYPWQPDATGVRIEYEALTPGLPALQGKVWNLASQPLFQPLLLQERTIAIADSQQDLGIQSHADLIALFQQWQIGSLLLVPIRYQETWLGVLEIQGHKQARLWTESDIALVEAIAMQVGVALIQAQAYLDLEAVNQQLKVLEQSQINLIAIVGHELRTPLSTIQIFLESLADDPAMPLEIQQSMLTTALGDSERLRELVQDFLTLSRLESGTTQWQIEPVSLQEIVDLAVSKFQFHRSTTPMAKIVLAIPPQLPLLNADGEGIMQVLVQLLENACKFTDPQGMITIAAQVLGQSSKPDPEMIEITISDTGRGIEADRLETIFKHFYQTEGFMQRTVGGTGLGLAIARQIVQQLGGKLWATSAGKNQGSTFHFTVAIAVEVSEGFVQLYRNFN